MQGSEKTELGPGQSGLEQGIAAAPAVATPPGLVPAGWQGKVSELETDALEVFWVESLRYAAWEIGRYGQRGREPVLASGYDAKAIVQASFERLVEREAGGVPILYSAEDIREELRSLIKHRVRWLHERSETRLVVGEWDVLPARANGELESIFDWVPSGFETPDRAVMRMEKERLLGEFKAGFEGTLGKQEELRQVFESAWEGERRQELVQVLGAGAQRAKALRNQLSRRLVKFCGKARGGIKEMLAGVREGA
jgi:hypothetical protein